MTGLTRRVRVQTYVVRRPSAWPCPSTLSPRNPGRAGGDRTRDADATRTAHSARHDTASGMRTVWRTMGARTGPILPCDIGACSIQQVYHTYRIRANTASTCSSRAETQRAATSRAPGSHTRDRLRVTQAVSSRNTLDSRPLQAIRVACTEHSGLADDLCTMRQERVPQP